VFVICGTIHYVGILLLSRQ